MSESMVYKWLRQVEEIRTAMSKNKSEMLKYDQGVALNRSPRGRRLSLCRGRAAKFPLAELETHVWFKESREKGLSIGAMLLTATMKNQVRKHYGSAALTCFMASKKWRRCWCLRFSVGLRHKTNKKALSAAERLPKAKHFFARLRWRLRKGESAKSKATPHPSSSSSIGGGGDDGGSGGGGSGDECGGAALEEQRHRIERQHRGRDGAAVVAAQGPTVSPWTAACAPSRT